MSLYSEVSDEKLAEMLQGELNLHMLNDTAAREKIAEAVTRLGKPKSESKIVKALRQQLAEKSKKLEKIEKILRA